MKRYLIERFTVTGSLCRVIFPELIRAFVTSSSPATFSPRRLQLSDTTTTLPSHLLLLRIPDTAAKMANYLASIFGTEQDKVNCTFPAPPPILLKTTNSFTGSFYYKIGACRHGDRCSRKHVKPSYSQTILLPNLYQNPAFDPKNKMNPSQLQNHFDAFYEDFFCEMCKYGEVEEVVVCDNNNDRELPFPSPFGFWHANSRGADLIGNVYARFKYEEDAQTACDALNARWYAARPIYCELSPVTDFREACCRLNSGEGCVRGGFCNFIHRKEPSKDLERELELSMKKWLKMRGRDKRSVTRSPSPGGTVKRRRDE